MLGALIGAASMSFVLVLFTNATTIWLSFGGLALAACYPFMKRYTYYPQVVLGAAFARLARQYPEMNSPDDYVRPALGRDMGFLATTLYWISSWMGNNAIAVAAFGYLVILLPIDDGGSVRLVGQVVLIWLMFALNLLGPRSIARFQSMCVIFGLLPVVAVLIAGWGSFDADIYRDGWNVTENSDTAVVFGGAVLVWLSNILGSVLRGAGVTAVFVEHDMDVVARFADRVAVWSQGRILALGPPSDVLADPAVRRDVIGIEAHG